MSDRLSTKKAMQLLFQSGCSSGVIMHCKAVSTLAVQIAEACKKKGLEVNIKLVKFGALLHDVGRSKTYDVNHVIKGAEIARSLNLPESVVFIIERHAGGGITIEEAQKLYWPPRSYIPNTLEEKIVTYADKLIEKTHRIPVERTLKKLSRVLGKNHRSIVRVKKLHQEFVSLLGELSIENYTS